MADTNNPYFRADVISPEEELRQNYIGLQQIKTKLSSLKVGSAEYKKYKASLDATNARIKELNDVTNAARDAAKTKETAGKREKLVDALQRAKDYGTPDTIKKAQDALNSFDGKNPEVVKEVRYGPNGETLVPGSTEYTSGSTIKPKVVTTPVVTTKPVTSSAVTSSTGTGTTKLPAMGKGSDPKGIWISALDATFKTGIDDPKQKKQIDDLIAKAKLEKWNEATFMEAMKNTSWWQQTFPTLRQFFIDSHDPRQTATFAQTMLNKIDTIQAKMDLLGIKVNDIDPVTGKVIDNTKIIQGIAAQAMQNGWDDNQLSQHLATKSEIIFTGGGTLGSYVDQIKRQALNYGLALDKNELDTINHDLLNPTDGKDAQWYLNNIKQRSIDANPAFAASLKEGRTLYDVTGAYRKQMADLLEIDPTNITWNDLMSKVMNKDKGVAYTFADFTKQVKSDPLWQRTKNAKETYSNTALDLMKQFGFLG